MESKIFEIVNQIRENKGEVRLVSINGTDDLRNDLGLDSFDLAELTVHIEVEYDIDIFKDGIVNTIDEIYKKLE